MMGGLQPTSTERISSYIPPPDRASYGPLVHTSPVDAIRIHMIIPHLESYYDSEPINASHFHK